MMRSKSQPKHRILVTSGPATVHDRRSLANIVQAPAPS
jgi:hypothetical protein